MKHTEVKRSVRLVAAMLVMTAVVGVSALAMQASTQTLNSLAPSLKTIQTDKSTSFYAARSPSRTWFVEQVLPSDDSKAQTENLKVITAAL